ncbi:hypothetical protein OO17_13045 [Rhodopseudomonas palustris]|uniref:Uncharacterized protein n=2 Tax=Nitrobacteraceae TaxID=41294 RepID=A0A0D7ENH9_RHOPL|nr:hypothetical protein OO17_13045 [Rhodopseudomonas palustris]
MTCSFRGDFEICALLCESVDRFVPDIVQHLLYVPASDLALFAPLASARRRIIAEETLLPAWFWKIPMPPARWRRLLSLPRRNIYLTPFSLPVRGWIAQQIMKIAGAAQSPTEIILHVDSDAEFVRPFSVDDLYQAGAGVRLFRRPHVDAGGHRSWHLSASQLMGLPPDEFHDGDYIDSLVVWRRSVVRQMIERIAQIGGRDWRIQLARTQHFSEYLLYGVFAERVLGLAEAGLAVAPMSLCHTRWSDAFADAEDETNFITSLDPRMIASCVQSTIALSLPQRRALHERMVAFAASQDPASGAGAAIADRR